MSQDGAEEELNSQVVEIEAESSDESAAENSAPAVRPARRRTNVVPISEASVPENDEPNPAETAETLQRAPGEPPVFSCVLQLEPKNLKEFQKALKTHKKSTNMKKLSCLDYFATRFSEMAYFEVQEGQSALSGVLGYGNFHLITQIKDQFLTEEVLPSVFGVLAEGEVFAGPVESLREEDAQGLATLGFTATQFIGAFPITYKKAVTGLWLCGAAAPVEVDQKELAALKKLFTNFIL